ncbi:MAG: 3-phosphoshikimate 1-carboxyvinyltransferase [Inquilinaceae bacterium]
MLTAHRSGPLTGDATVPGDKSISHRALMLSGLAIGQSTISGLLEGEDVLRTAAAMRALGVTADRSADGTWTVEGVGVGGLSEPETVLDMGNSGTGARLLCGVLATHPLTAFMTGDASLVGRPMGRVTAPLETMGAAFVTRSEGRLPMAVLGSGDATPITYVLPVASAQVKSAILLAGLNTPGLTTVIEPHRTRDHSEHMLRHFGADIRIEDGPEGQAVAIVGQPELTGRTVVVPGDISSAAFLIVAALVAPGSDVLLRGVGLNPRRTGLIDTLIEMGADIAITEDREDSGERMADLRVRASTLTGVDVPPERAPSMIDEYPILAVAAACAQGTTRMHGIGELRVKESDRLAMMANGLSACGAAVDMGADWLTVTGTGRPPPGGARVTTALDHRIAMSFLVLGLATADPVGVDDASPIGTSFPGFAALINGLGRPADDTSGALLS